MRRARARTRGYPQGTGIRLHLNRPTAAVTPALRPVLRPPIAQDKLQQRRGGLVRIVLKSPVPTAPVAEAVLQEN